MISLFADNIVAKLMFLFFSVFFYYPATSNTTMANRHLFLCIVICSYVAIGRSEDYYISSNIDDPSHFDNQSNTTFYFSNGSHELHYRFVFKDVANISLIGTGGVKNNLESTASDTYYEPFSRIVCTNPSSGFSFFNVTYVFIANITFANCGNNTAPIYFFSTYSFMIDIVSIENATGYGIFQQGPNPTQLQYDSIIGSPLATITRSSFIIIDGTAISFNSLSQLNISDSKFIGTTYGIIAVNSSQLYLTNCTFFNSTVSLTTASPMLTYSFFVYVDHCNFINSVIGYSSVGAITILNDCTFYNTTTAISTFGTIRSICMQCTFENCATGINASVSDFTIINQSKFDNVKHPTHFVSLYEAAIIDSSFNNYINAGLYTYSFVVIENSNFSNSRSSIIYAIQSEILFFKNVSFSNGYSIGYGGALYLRDSYIVFNAPTRVSFINNTAPLGGGAIYSEYQNSNLYCFFRIYDETGTLSSPGVQLYFKGNKAGEVGKDVYASLNCTPSDSYAPLYDTNNKTNLDILKLLSASNDSLSSSNDSLDIAADPLVVCMSYGTINQCSNNQSEPLSILLHPGQTKTISLTTMDEYNGTTPSVVFFTYPDGSVYNAIRTTVNGTRYDIKYIPGATLSLVPQVLFKFDFSSGYKMLRISIMGIPCPQGFTLNAEKSACECITLFKDNNVTCNLTDMSLSKPSYSWIGNTSDGGVLFYESCSPDYCNTKTTVNLDAPDEQCNNNHSGVLCGGCAHGYSEVFGGPLCKKCSNMYLLLLIPFALMGMALVALLIILNMTVSNGTLNGFIFYANIIKINDEIFRPTYSTSTATTVLSTFISWLNLDLGIVTCFYGNMDVPGKMWVQFAFPVYIFLLVGAIVLVGRYSTRVSRLCRHNVVPVMATLILMSYTKLLKTSINIFSRAAVLVEHNSTLSNNVVWRHDGNIGYFRVRGGHLQLFIAAVLLVALFIVPYMLLMLLSSCAVTKSHWKIFCWFNKIKPFIDSYEGPYISRHRFWTGFLLLIRIPIYVTTAAVEVAHSNITLILVIFVATGLVIYLGRFGVYKKWQYFLLELFLFVNLLVLFQLTLFFRGYNDVAVSSPSSGALLASYSITVGSALVLFIAILIGKSYVVLHELLRPQKVLQETSTYSIYDNGNYLEIVRYTELVEENNETNNFRQELIS